MKNIELNKKQKEMLLEMCKSLFPEQEFFWEYEMYGRGLKQDFNDVLCVYFKDKNAYKKQLFPFNIHWFEFCIIELYPILKINGTISYHSLIRGDNHIVDALYEEFKKLKK